MNADKTFYLLMPERSEVMDEQQKSSYYITLEQTSTTPRDIFMCEYYNEEEIKNEEHNICFYGGAESYHGLFISKVLADTEAQALKRAIKIRNEAIANGEWNQAWERHKLQQSR